MATCVIVVENLPVPLDRRVWQEALALREAGWTVSVICPATSKYPKRKEIIQGIYVFRHPLPVEARGAWSFLIEYTFALFHQFRLLFVVHRTVGFDIIQACNPPDLIFLVIIPWMVFGKKFVFDQHDVCPELVIAKFGKRRVLKRLALWAEKLSFKSVHLVICANETFRRLAISRGGKLPGDVVTVYSVPNKMTFDRTGESGNSRTANKIIVGYVGIINSQDGVDNIILMAQDLVAKHNMHNFQCTIVGDGPALPRIKSMVTELQLASLFVFTGYLEGASLLNAISKFDIGIIPDPVNCYNDKISMNKVFEYAAMGLPIVSFANTETKRLLGDAALFSCRNDAGGLADQVARLIADVRLRDQLGRRAKNIADAEFDWTKEACKYVTAFENLLNPGVAAQPPAT